MGVGVEVTGGMDPLESGGAAGRIMRGTRDGIESIDWRFVCTSAETRIWPKQLTQ
jgi:hypothetical protein